MDTIVGYQQLETAGECSLVAHVGQEEQWRRHCLAVASTLVYRHISLWAKI